MSEPVTPLAGTKRPSHAPLMVHPLVQAIDHLAELVAVAGAVYLCAMGKVAFEGAGAFMLLVLGVQTGIRKGLGAKTGSGGAQSGALGVLFVALGSAYLRSKGMLAHVVTLGVGLVCSAALVACSPAQMQSIHDAAPRAIGVAQGVCRFCNAACRLVPGAPQNSGSGGDATPQKLRVLLDVGACAADPRPKVPAARLLGVVPTWRPWLLRQ